MSSLFYLNLIDTTLHPKVNTRTAPKIILSVICRPKLPKRDLWYPSRHTNRWEYGCCNQSHHRPLDRSSGSPDHSSPVPSCQPSLFLTTVRSVSATAKGVRKLIDSLWACDGDKLNEQWQPDSLLWIVPLSTFDVKQINKQLYDPKGNPSLVESSYHNVAAGMRCSSLTHFQLIKTEALNC